MVHSKERPIKGIRNLNETRSKPRWLDFILFAAEMRNEGVGILSNKAVSYEESEELPLHTFKLMKK